MYSGYLVPLERATEAEKKLATAVDALRTVLVICKAGHDAAYDLRGDIEIEVNTALRAVEDVK